MAMARAWPRRSRRTSTSSLAMAGSFKAARRSSRTFRSQFDGWLPGSRSVAEVINVRFLSDDVAVVHTFGGIMFPGETDVQPDWVGIQTWVVIEEDGEWLATAYQNSRVSPEVQAATPASE